MKSNVLKTFLEKIAIEVHNKNLAVKDLLQSSTEVKAKKTELSNHQELSS